MSSLYQRLREWQRSPETPHLSGWRRRQLGGEGRNGSELASRLDFRRAFFASPVPQFIADTEGRLLASSAAFDRLCGPDTASELSRGCSMRALGVSEEAWRRLVTQVTSTPGITACKLRIETGHGPEDLVGALWTEATGDSAPRVHGLLLEHGARTRLERELGQSDQLRYVSELAGELAHDFNNLLTIMLSVSELMLMTGELGPSLSRRAKSVVSACQRAASLTAQLLSLSRKLPEQWPVSSVSQLVDETLLLLRRVVPEVEIRTRVAPEIGALRTDTVQIEQVLVGLVIHVRDALPPGEAVGIYTQPFTVGEPEAVALDLPKPGPYVAVVLGAASELDQLLADEADALDLFGAEHARTSGLGLTSAQGVVRHAGGQLAMERSANHTPRFALSLPLVVNVQAPRDRQTGPHDPHAHTILVAEDEELVRQLTSMLLRDLGYTVLEAADGVQALALAKQHQGPIHLLLTDVMMPNMGGVELSRELRNVLPDVHVLYMSGHSDETLLRQGLPKQEAQLLPKPFTKNSLAAAVRRSLRPTMISAQARV